MKYKLVKEIICEYFGITVEQLESDCTTRKLSEARKICVKLMYNLIEESTQAEIVAQIKRVEPSYVTYCRKNIGGIIESDKDFREMYKEIELLVWNKLAELK